jgi:hypothetical protein
MRQYINVLMIFTRARQILSQEFSPMQVWNHLDEALHIDICSLRTATYVSGPELLPYDIRLIIQEIFRAMLI